MARLFWSFRIRVPFAGCISIGAAISRVLSLTLSANLWERYVLIVIFVHAYILYAKYDPLI